MMSINEKFENLANFLVSYFTDTLGKPNITDIIKEAVSENTKPYLDKLINELQDFNTSEYSVDEKANFIRNANLYFENDAEAIEWLKQLEEDLHSFTKITF